MYCLIVLCCYCLISLFAVLFCLLYCLCVLCVYVLYVLTWLLCLFEVYVVHLLLNLLLWFDCVLFNVCVCLLFASTTFYHVFVIVIAIIVITNNTICSRRWSGSLFILPITKGFSFFIWICWLWRRSIRPFLRQPADCKSSFAKTIRIGVKEIVPGGPLGM